MNRAGDSSDSRYSNRRSDASGHDHRVPLILLALLALIVLVSGLNPFDRLVWVVESLLVFALAIGLIASYRNFRFSNLNYAWLLLFVALHLIGAHYTYVEAPPGLWLADWLQLERNYYDRMMHFAFGLLVAPPVAELLNRAAGLRPAWCRWLTVAVVVALSSVYELIEAAVAILADPALGVPYLATQGDIWDAQKDIALALVAATISVMFLVWPDRRDRDRANPN